MKYRVKHVDTSWLFFTPFSFLNMGGTDLYVLECKKHWWSRWKKVDSYSSKEYAYKELNKLKHKKITNYERTYYRAKSKSLR